MSKNPSYYWQYIDSKLDSLTDPRLPITKHIQWTLPVGPTTYSGAEPDNYNLAIYDHKPHDFKFIEHQCFYLVDKIVNRRKFLGWISLYVAEERLQTILFNREIIKLQPQAVWRFDRAKPIRSKKTQLQREKFHHNSKIGILTTEERLYQQGYYEKLKNKYFDDEKFLKVVGTPRGCVLNPEPEVLDYDGL
jgi:hypothetical protein